jgi:hypothetical protein
MTMHLEGPWLTTNGKWRTKRRKYASAAAAQQERELSAEWQQRKAQWSKLVTNFSTSKSQIKPARSLAPQYPPGREPQEIPSKTDTVGVAARPADKVYTGTKIKGIGTLHKSNAVPIFTDDEAKDIAHMRR